MSSSEVRRFLIPDSPSFVNRPKVRLQPILARSGSPSVNLDLLKARLNDYATFEDLISIQSPQHWEEVIYNLPIPIDAVLPLSNPAYPTEIWNAHPLPLIRRGVPVIFWSLMEHDEPDFWRFAARDLLRTLGAEVYLVHNHAEGIALIKALSTRRFFRQGKMVVFGEQNFPWNANAVGDRVTRSLGIQILVKPLEEIRARYPQLGDEEVILYWQARRGTRYVEKGVLPQHLLQAVRTSLAIRQILIEEQAFGFGVNCFGDLVISGKRDTPCLAQLLLREEGFISACDGDFIAMVGIAIGAYYLDKPSMTSNLYPLLYAGALLKHFGSSLSAGKAFAHLDPHQLARMAHCGFVGIVSPEMTSSGNVYLRDWGGTFEIQRDGRGCGIDADLVPGETITALSLNFSADHLMVTQGEVLETTRHANMPHCESSLLLRLDHLIHFFEQVSRDHVVILYGNHVHDLRILAEVLGLKFTVF